MRVALFDSWGYATSWALRLQDEGAKVLVYLGNEKPVGHVGDDMFPKEESYDRWVAWAEQDPDTVVLFCNSGYGEKADDLRKRGMKVVGGGTFADKLEQDRQFGQSIAESVGMKVPKFQAFTSISDGIDWCRGQREGGVFKSDSYLESDATQVCRTGEHLERYLRHVRDRYRDRVTFIVQELIGGKGSVDFDLNRWWDGQEFVGPHGLTLEHKRALNDDFGPSTGCAVTAFWAEDEPEFARTVNFDGLADVFARYQAPPGIYAYNFRIDDETGEANYLETTPRLGFDSEPTAAMLVDSLTDFLWRVATGEGSTTISNDLAYGVRLTVPPYPFEDVENGKHSAVGLPLPEIMGDGYQPPFLAYQVKRNHDGELEVASPEGLVGIASAVGDDLETMGEDVLDFAREVHKGLSKLQLRTDGVAVMQSDAEKLEALGVSVHPALLKGDENASTRSA